MGAGWWHTQRMGIQEEPFDLAHSHHKQEASTCSHHLHIDTLEPQPQCVVPCAPCDCAGGGCGVGLGLGWGYGAAWGAKYIVVGALLLSTCSCAACKALGVFVCNAWCNVALGFCKS